MQRPLDVMVLEKDEVKSGVRDVEGHSPLRELEQAFGLPEAAPDIRWSVQVVLLSEFEDVNGRGQAGKPRDRDSRRPESWVAVQVVVP